MQREEMICFTYLYGQPAGSNATPTIQCRFMPVTTLKEDDDWCGQGEWEDGPGEFICWGGWEKETSEEQEEEE